MRLDDQIRELCAIAASPKDPASLFHALHELKELIREHDLSREIGLIANKQRLASDRPTAWKRRFPPLQS
jgi:hypothetical protein